MSCREEPAGGRGLAKMGARATLRFSVRARAGSAARRRTRAGRLPGGARPARGHGGSGRPVLARDGPVLPLAVLRARGPPRRADRPAPGIPLGTNTLGIAVEYPDGAFSTWAVPPSTGDLGDPAWGPDAERVAFTRSVLSPHDKYGQAEIPWVTVVDSEGGPEHRIARGTAPSWSAADRIIYRGGKRGLFSISPTGRGRRHLTHGATDDDPDWAPSGGSFASSRGGAIWVGHAGAARARSPVRREGRRTRRRPGARTAGASRSSASARAAPSAPRTPATWRAWRHAAAGWGGSSRRGASGRANSRTRAGPRR